MPGLFCGPLMIPLSRVSLVGQSTGKNVNSPMACSLPPCSTSSVCRGRSPAELPAIARTLQAFVLAVPDVCNVPSLPTVNTHLVIA